jgi:hypothetical protein
LNRDRRDQNKRGLQIFCGVAKQVRTLLALRRHQAAKTPGSSVEARGSRWSAPPSRHRADEAVGGATGLTNIRNINRTGLVLRTR